MTIHVNMGAAKTRLSELVAAAVRGEDVVLDKAGLPQVRLVPVTREAPSVEEIAAKRRKALGMFKHLVGDRSLDVSLIKRQDREYQAALDKKYGPAD